ncbi:hypothetical protein [Rhodocaloribacter sp.]
MKRHAIIMIMMSFVLSACAATDVVRTYERDDLVSVQHNDANSYTLLTYLDSLGQTRQVLRRYGVCEIVVTYTLTGEILLKERGRGERVIGAVEASRITRHINAVLGISDEPESVPRERITSI